MFISVVDGAGIEPASLHRCTSAVFQPLALTALNVIVELCRSEYVRLCLRSSCGHTQIRPYR